MKTILATGYVLAAGFFATAGAALAQDNEVQIRQSASDTHIGHATDGDEIHYVESGAQPGWTLKQGARPSGRGGAHDGTYVCFATTSFPFNPHCFRGEVSSDFGR